LFFFFFLKFSFLFIFPYFILVLTHFFIMSPYFLMKMKNLKHIPAFTAAILLVFALSAGAAAQPVSVVRDLPFKAAVDSSLR